MCKQRADHTGDSSSSEASKCEKAGVVPAVHKALSDQLVQLTLGQHIVGEVEARVLPHHRLVLLQHLY